MAVTELSRPLELETMEVAIMKLPCHFETTKVAIAELLAQYEEMAVAEWKVLVYQKEWQVHCLQVMTLVFDLTVYVASIVISAHLKFHTGYTI
jgi:L-ribulose-5-phosphate 3-epimerase UlaE